MIDYYLMKEEKSTAPAQPAGMVVYRESGVFQRLHLCEYLRELTEGQAEEAVKTDAATSTPDIEPAP